MVGQGRRKEQTVGQGRRKEQTVGQGRRTRQGKVKHSDTMHILCI